MPRMRNASALGRAVCAALLALLLSLRMIGAAGYMPAFEHGAVSIIACPGADENAPLALNTAHRHDHHHGHSNDNHGSCPYAAAASLGALGPDWTPLLAALLFALVPLAGRASISSIRQLRRERPPSRAPPVPA